MPKKINYLIRDISPKLWTDFKHLAIEEKCSLRLLIIKAIETYLKGGKLCQ